MNMNKKIDEALDSRMEGTDFIPIIKFVGGLIYLTGLIYAGSHIYTFVGSLMGADFLRIMAWIGATGMILNGAVLPVAIHIWTMERTHRLVAIFFYVLDIALIGGFVWANTNMVRGTNILLAEQYMEYVSPITFLNTIITWGALTILDPANRLKYRLHSATMKAQEIDIKAHTYKAIVDAEARAQELFLASGIDLDDHDYIPTRTTRMREPEPYKFPAHKGKDFWDIEPAVMYRREPEQPEEPEEPYWKHTDLYNKLSNQPDFIDFAEEPTPGLTPWTNDPTEIPGNPGPSGNHSGNHSGSGPKE